MTYASVRGATGTILRRCDDGSARDWARDCRSDPVRRGLYGRRLVALVSASEDVVAPERSDARLAQSIARSQPHRLGDGLQRPVAASDLRPAGRGQTRELNPGFRVRQRARQLCWF